MMENQKKSTIWSNNITAYIIAVLVFLAITIAYFSPVLEGKKLDQHDISMHKGMSKEIVDHRESTGEEALWTNSMFGGMPAWQISVVYKGNLMTYVDKVITLGLPTPLNFVFLYFLGFFILLLVLKTDKWVALIGAIAFALSSYFFIILGAGHTSKAHAIGYMALVLAGIILTFRGKYWQGGLLTAVALSLEIKSGHLQITYYLLIIVVIYGIYQLIETIKNNNYAHFLKASGLLIVAALLAILTHSTNLWATYDYGKDSMRGKPELTNEAENKSGGLDRSYITDWSYGIGETWSLMIPYVKGKASGVLGNVDELKHADPAYRKVLAQQTNAYWGDQPGTSGSVYVGIIVVFLFILGLFIVDNRLKWALLAATVLSILLAWGKNFMPFTDFFIDYIPGYNKFRAVSMTLAIAELTIPVLAFMALNKVLTERKTLNSKIKAFYYASGITVGVLILFYITPNTFFNFLNAGEKLQFSQLRQSNDPSQVDVYVSSLENVRIAIFKTDTLRSLFFLIASIVLIYFFIKGKLKAAWFLTGIGLLILVDMFSVDKRYINNDNFVRSSKFEQPFTASTADNYILKDHDPDFRVLDISKSTFNDASCSYFHKSIGGYHGAKLQRYQDIIEHQIQPEIQEMVSGLQSGVTMDKINSIFKNLQVLNMLNTKYVIYSPDAMPIINPMAYGNAWFVNNYELVKSADEEIDAINDYDLNSTAIIDNKFADQLKDFHPDKDSTATISLISYEPNNLIYKYNSTIPQLVVFSEIYYNKGWEATIDGKPTEHLRADYILRSMKVPAGNHTIEFSFEPKIFIIGERISFIASLLLIILIIGTLIYGIKQCRLSGKQEEKKS